MIVQELRDTIGHVPARTLVVFALLGALVTGCASRARPPTITGAQLYAQVPLLLDEGQVTIATTTRPVKVRLDQMLVTPDRTQMFAVRAVSETCLGDRPDSEPACTLSSLRELRFEVYDTQPISSLPGIPEESEGMGVGGKALISALLLAAPLTYGVSTCEFEGCKAVFGIPLTAVGIGLVFILVGMK